MLDESTKEIVLFHPDSICAEYLINLVPDDSLDEQLAIERERLESDRTNAETERLAQLLVRTF